MPEDKKEITNEELAQAIIQVNKNLDAMSKRELWSIAIHCGTLLALVIIVWPF